MRDAAVLIACLALGILQVMGKRGGVAPHLLDPQCAVERHFGTQNRVINGTNADILSNPWMAQIVDGGFMICGGSLISNRYVLTAAHCQGTSNRGLRVRLGDYNLATRFDCTNQGCIPRPEDFAVTHVFTEASYQDYHNHDLALLRLAVTVRYGVHIRPVCLLMGGTANWRRNILQSIHSFNVTGWGRTATTKTPYVLQQTSLLHYDNSHCARTFQREVDSTHICAGRTTSATCNGDSGGPLTARSTALGGNHIVLFGLVSYGRQYCNGPTVFTNILSFADWIKWHITNNP